MARAATIYCTICILLITMFHSVTANLSTNSSTNFTFTFLTSPYAISTQFHPITTVDPGNVGIFGLKSSQLTIIGVTLCALLFISIVICCVVLCMKHQKRQKQRKLITADEKDPTQAKIDAFDVHITRNAFAAHSVNKAYSANPLNPTKRDRVTSASAVENQSAFNKANSSSPVSQPDKPITVGALMNANAHVQPKDIVSNVTAETPAPNETKPEVKHLKVNLYDDMEEESLRTLELTPHTPSDADAVGHMPQNSANTMRYDANAPSQLTLLTDQPSNETLEDQDTMRSLPDQDTIRSNETNDTIKYIGDQNTPTMNDSNDSNDSTYDAAPAAIPIQVPDTLTAIIQQHKNVGGTAAPPIVQSQKEPAT